MADATQQKLKEHTESLRKLIEDDEAKRVERMKEAQDNMVEIHRHKRTK